MLINTDNSRVACRLSGCRQKDTYRILSRPENQLPFQLVKVEPILRLARLLVHAREEPADGFDDLR
jgi:hypothetical protein